MAPFSRVGARRREALGIRVLPPNKEALYYVTFSEPVNGVEISTLRPLSESILSLRKRGYPARNAVNRLLLTPIVAGTRVIRPSIFWAFFFQQASQALGRSVDSL